MVNLLLSLVVQKEFNSDIVQSIVDRVNRTASVCL